MEGVRGVCGGLAGDAGGGNAAVGSGRLLVKEGASDLPCGAGGRELRPQQGQLVSVPVSSSSGEEYYVLPEARGVC